jgi:D-glycero-D-manno-heptose 1,7-bisphosphate phosphatase
MKKAVFLDRDGVLNRLVFNPATGAFEAPQKLEDFVPSPGLGSALVPLIRSGYLLFLISNQPDYAKGKASLEVLRAIHEKLDTELKASGVQFKEYFYCYHHPESLVPALKGPCGCRKPGTLFLDQTVEKYGLDCSASWMVGDQDTDVECGRKAGLRTVALQTPESAKRRGQQRADYTAGTLEECSQIILGFSKEAFRAA